MDQPGKVANPARGQLNREKNIPLSPCVPENLVSRDGFSRPIPRGKNLIDGEMLCLGTVSTNLFRLFYAGEIQNLNCRRMEMATYFFLTRG